MSYRDDREAAVARADALARELDETKRALAEAESALVEAQRPTKRQAKGPKPKSQASRVRADVNPKESADTEAAAPRGRRRRASIFSVFTRAWVIVVLGLPALVAIPMMLSSRALRVPVGLGLLGLAILVITIDAFRRRCPKCRILLGGRLERLVNDDYGDHVRHWQCASCAHRWKTVSSRVGPSS